MPRLRFMPLFFLLLPVIYSCNKKLDVNADWKDITVVYGLLDQTQDTTFIKITKAFLGPGDALRFAKIPDSSNYPVGSLEVRLDEYQGTGFIQSYRCETIIRHSLNSGITIFDTNKLLYFTTVNLKQDYTYKLYIKNKRTGKEITSQTDLVHDFSINKPTGNAITFQTDQSFNVKWEHPANGKRYQLVVRFFYSEDSKANPNHPKMHSVDWFLFNNIYAIDATNPQSFDLWFSCDAFYKFVGASIDTSSLVTREAHHCLFIITAAAPDLTTFIEVSEPSLSLVQEKPPYTNIVNGIGIFSSRITASDSIGISKPTKKELYTNSQTQNRGFLDPGK